MTKIVSDNVLAIIAAVNHQENPCEVSTVVRKNSREVNNAMNYQEKQINITKKLNA